VFKKKKSALRKFARIDILSKITPHLSLKKQYWKSVLMITAVMFFIFSLARPQFGTKMEVIKRKGIDLFVLLDVSKSMLADDISPNRLTRAKMEIDMIINQLRGDRVGIMIFSGIPFIQCPLTVDYSAAKMMLEIISPELIPVQGTNINDALQMARNSFVGEDNKSKVILLISDGEDHEGDIEKIAEEIGNEGIKIFTVGMGSTVGVPIPEFDGNGNKTGLKKDRAGNIIVTKLNETVLEKIALMSNGKYYHATASQNQIHKIFEEIEKMDKKDFDSKKFSQYEERFYVPLIIGLILLIIESLLPDRKRKGKIWKGRFAQ